MELTSFYYLCLFLLVSALLYHYLSERFKLNGLIFFVLIFLFLPKVLAGPLAFSLKKEEDENFVAKGFFLIAIGLIMKLIVSESILLMLNAGSLATSLNFVQAWLMFLGNLVYVFSEIQSY